MEHRNTPRALFVAIALSSLMPPFAARCVARVANTTLAQLAVTADVIAVGTDRSVENLDGTSVARFAVEQVLAGPRMLTELSYVAEGAWACDTAHAVPGERALLFLRRLPDRSPPLHVVHWSGRGRMPIREHGGRAWAAARVNNIELPSELPTDVGPDPDVPWLRDVALDPLVSAVVAALWKHRAWRGAQAAAAALGVLVIVRFAPWFVRRLRADLREARLRPPAARIARVGRIVWLACLGISALFALWIAIGFTWTERMWKKADHAWRNVNRSDAELMERYPTQFMNSTGFALHLAARDLGIPLLTRTGSIADWRPQPFVVLADDYLRDLLGSPGGSIPTPSPELETARVANRDRIEHVLDLLLGDPMPRFASSLEPERTESHLQGVSYRTLGRLLLFEALDGERLGDPIGATRAIEAAWRLIDIAAIQASFRGTFLEFDAYAELATALRYFPTTRPLWLERLRDTDLLSRVRDAYQADIHETRGHFWDLPISPSDRTADADAEDPDRLGPMEAAMGFWLFAPIQRFDASLMASWHAAVLESWIAAPRCSRAPAAPPIPLGSAGRAFDVATPWSAPGPAVIRPLVADRVHLRMELTRLVIDARATRARLGRFELPQSDSVESYCPGERWIYELAPDGALTIRFSGIEAMPQLLRPEHLPLKFQIPAAG